MVSCTPSGAGPIARRVLMKQNHLLAASNVYKEGDDDDKFSDVVPGSRDMSVSRAVC